MASNDTRVVKTKSMVLHSTQPKNAAVKLPIKIRVCKNKLITEPIHTVSCSNSRCGMRFFTPLNGLVPFVMDVTILKIWGFG